MMPPKREYARDFAEVDLSQPLSVLLDKATYEKHESIRHVVKRVFNRHLTTEVYAQYLIIHHRLYATMETTVATHSTHPLLSPLYDPALLSRAPRIQSDISHLLSTSAWSSHPFALRYHSTWSPSQTQYLDRLADLSLSRPPPVARNMQYPCATASPLLLLAQAYVRYGGDLSGGQMIRGHLGKVIPEEALSLYDYDSGLVPKLGSASKEGEAKAGVEGTSGSEGEARASPSEVKQIRRWFVQTVNKIGETLTNEEKVDLLQESLLAFELNIRVMTAFADIVAPIVPAPIAAPVAPTATSATRCPGMRAMQEGRPMPGPSPHSAAITASASVSPLLASLLHRLGAIGGKDSVGVWILATVVSLLAMTMAVTATSMLAPVGAAETA